MYCLKILTFQADLEDQIKQLGKVNTDFKKGDGLAE